MSTISQRELRNDNARIIARVQAGEAFVVTRRGVPIADLAPHRADLQPDTYLDSATIVAALADLPDLDSDAWLEDVREVDDMVDDNSRDPWQTA